MRNDYAQHSVFMTNDDLRELFPKRSPKGSAAESTRFGRPPTRAATVFVGRNVLKAVEN